MAVDTSFADLFDVPPQPGVLGPLPLDPSQGQMNGLLPPPPAAQPTGGVLGEPFDRASLVGPPFDPMQLITGGQGLSVPLSPLEGGWVRALMALNDSLRGASPSGLPGGVPAGQGVASPDAAGPANGVSAASGQIGGGLHPPQAVPAIGADVVAAPPTAGPVLAFDPNNLVSDFKPAGSPGAAADAGPTGGPDASYEVAANGLIPGLSSGAALERRVLQTLAARANDPLIHYDPNLGTLGQFGVNPDGSGSFTPMTADEIQSFKERQLGAQCMAPGVKSPQEQFLDAQIASTHQFQPGDQELLARIIYAETSSIPQDSAAIGWATVNGMRPNETLSEALQRANRFQIVPAGGGPPGGSRQWKGSADPSQLTDGDAAAWAAAQKAAAGIIDGSIPDPTGGATQFFSSDHYNPKIPKTAPGDFPRMLIQGKLGPSAYRSHSSAARRNYFFVNR